MYKQFGAISKSNSKALDTQMERVMSGIEQQVPEFMEKQEAESSAKMFRQFAGMTPPEKPRNLKEIFRKISARHLAEMTL